MNKSNLLSEDNLIPPDIGIPWFLKAVIGLGALVKIALIARERIFPVTLADIKKMHFKDIVEYLESKAVIDLDEELCNVAADRGINIWSRVTSADLSRRFQAFLAVQKRDEQLKRFEVRLTATSYGELEPESELVTFA